MKCIYHFYVTETVKKYVEVEAETQEEAEEIAANVVMDKNYDSYDRKVTLFGKITRHEEAEKELVKYMETH